MTEPRVLPEETIVAPQEGAGPTPEPTPKITGGFLGLENMFGPKNAEDIKLTSQNKIAELNTQIQALQAEIKSKTSELTVKQNELKLYSSQRFSGGKKSKKTHKKSHKKSSRKTR